VVHPLRFRFSAALVAGLLFSGAMVSPSEAAPMDSVPSLDVVRNRLSLTPDQEAKLAPLFQQRISQLQDLRARLEQTPSRQEKRTILRDAKQKAESFNAQVESVLDVSQKQEWREMRAETREKLKEKYQENRASS
jgi:hypothetical protein